MFGIALIAVLAITGGAIAYIGDKLGTKVGKKKLTIFGLRPKHTSILVTIITGILITISTIGILTLMSLDVRTALFGMEALKTELTSLSQEVTAKNFELETNRNAVELSQRALEEKTAEYAALSIKVQDTTAKLASIASELAAAIAQRDHIAFQLQKAQADYDIAQGDLSSAKQAITTLQNTKNELDTRVNTLTDAKTTLQTDIDSLNELTSKLKQGIQTVREGAIIFRAGEILTTVVVPGGASRSDTEKALSEVIYKTNQNIIETYPQYATANNENKNLEVLWIAQEDFDKMVAAITANQQDIIVRISARANTIYGEPVIGQINMFINKHVYQQGQTIQMSIVDVRKTAVQPEETIMNFLKEVNGAAIKQGVLPDPLQGTVGAMNGTDFYDAVNAVRRCTGKVTLTATAKADTYTVGPLKIEIHVKESL